MTDERPSEDPREQDARILAMREGGASWKDIEAAFSLSRQRARHGYQRALRMKRRVARRSGE